MPGAVASFLGLLLFLFPARSVLAQPVFVDVSAEYGLDAGSVGLPECKHLVETLGAGVSLADFDGNGVLDIYITGHGVLRPRLGGGGDRRSLTAGEAATPVERPLTPALSRGERELAPPTGWGGGGEISFTAAVGDVNNDGFPDLYVTGFGADTLLLNLGSGNFASSRGVGDPGWTTGAVFFDADGDGDDDLFVASFGEATAESVANAVRGTDWRGVAWVLDGPERIPPRGDRFYLNTGEGEFVDATESSGLTAAAPAHGLSVVAFDADQDGDVDVFVANDTDPNHLLINDGDGRFVERAIEFGVAFDGNGAVQGSRGAAVGDGNKDGLPDLLVTHFAQDHDTLYRSVLPGVYEDASERTGFWAPTLDKLSWGAVLADFDGDGWDDVYLAQGHAYPEAEAFPELCAGFRQTDTLLWNRGGRFRSVTTPDARRAASRGLAAGDLDNDGDLDLVITHLDAPPAILRNESLRRGNWIGLDVRPAADGLPMAGSRVTVEFNGSARMLSIASGGSYFSESDRRLICALGEAAFVDRVVAAYPGGATAEWRDLSANRYWTLSPDSPPR